MKKLLFAIVPMALLLTLALGACGKSAADGGPGGGGGSTTASCATTQTISLAATDFVSKCVTVAANQAVTFDDPTSTGGVHIICTGKDAKCVADANAPKDLGAPGFPIQPGEQHQVTFATPGTYQLACTVHPDMNMTVIVK